MKNLVLVLGDQLDHQSAAFRGFDRSQDAVWMAEADQEITRVPSHKLRIAFFLSVMRHFRDQLQKKNRRVIYHELQRQAKHDRGSSFGEILTDDIRRLRPERLIVVEPGDDRVLAQIQETADDCGVELEVRADEHFYCSTEEFRQYAEGRKKLLMEFFYRHMRKTHGVLIDQHQQPVGGKWNFDHDNRESLGKQGPVGLSRPRRPRRDRVTTSVLELVAQRFADHPGELTEFTLPVTRRQALAFLNRFIDEVLPDFGRWEDAMWTGQPFLYHSRLSALLNTKLLNPRDCVQAAVAAWTSGTAPLNSVEGFVRQILGWREFIRGIYRLHMPDYVTLNHLNQHAPVPSFFWTGQTEMKCVHESMQHVLQHGYAHHIHRLMVLGSFSLLWGVHPRLFHDWHMAMYVDAVDWVSLPNTLGMSQFGDGGIVGTKPYCSTGNYINRMSNFCEGCQFDHRQRTGSQACPFTTLYWEFLDRNSSILESNHRMAMPMKNLRRLREQPDEMEAVRGRAAELRSLWG